MVQFLCKHSTTSEQNKSAITDHVATENHVIGWDKAKIMDREQNRNRRLIKESIWIRKRGHKTLNRDEGNYILPHIYDQLLKPSQQSTPPTSSSTLNSEVNPASVKRKGQKSI